MLVVLALLGTYNFGWGRRPSILLTRRERVRVLSERYNLTSREFDDIMRTPGGAINTLPPWLVARERGPELALREPWHTDTRPHKAAPPKQQALPAMVAIATARLVGAPALMTTRAPESAHLDAKKIRQLIKSAQRG